MADELILSGSTDKKVRYESLLPQIKALTEGEPDLIANLANIAAALKQGMDFFWVGFYFFRGNELVLGPFQGPIACTRIGIGKGVCGVAVEKNEVVIVPDVDQFPGHIACSAETRSEIVLPIAVNGKIVGVLDVDSDQLNSFDTTDHQYLDQIIQMIAEKWSF